MDTSERRGASGQSGVRVTGWVWFAGIMLIVAGGFNMINGFSAIERHQYFTNHIVYSNLSFWGWVFVIWGIMQLFAGFASVAGQMTGNYIGVLLASTATFLWFIMIFAESTGMACPVLPVFVSSTFPSTYQVTFVGSHSMRYVCGIWMLLKPAGAMLPASPPG